VRSTTVCEVSVPVSQVSFCTHAASWPILLGFQLGWPRDPKDVNRREPGWLESKSFFEVRLFLFVFSHGLRIIVRCCGRRVCPQASVT
jgi:hypothetical protein